MAPIGEELATIQIKRCKSGYIKEPCAQDAPASENTYGQKVRVLDESGFERRNRIIIIGIWSIAVLVTIAPIFLLIGLGYLSLQLNIVKPEDLRSISRFVVCFTLPAMIFHSVAARDFSQIFRLDYLGAYTLGSLMALALGTVQAKWLRGKSTTDSVLQGMGMSMSNTAYIGLPIAFQLIGKDATLAFSLNQIVENLLMFPLVLTLAEAGSGFKSSGSRGYNDFTFQLARRLIKNPMIIAIVAGVTVSGLHIPLPRVLDKGFEILAVASPGCALFVVGGSLVGAFSRTILPDIAIVTLGKLFIHPAMVFATFLMFPAMEPSLAKAAVVMASVPMLSIYPLIGQAYGRQGLCAATLTATTIVSFFTISALAYFWVI
eukprot:gene11100-11182_t